MRLKHRYWADYTAREFAALDRSRLIAVLPVAAVEQHGPHLPLSVDRDILNGIIAAAVPMIPEDCPALFLPACAVGKSNEHSAWPGTLTLSAATLMAMWTEIGDSVAAAGVRKLVMLNSHGGQVAPMDIVARDLRVKHGMLTVAANWFGMGLPEGLVPQHEERFGIHAGEVETSMMLTLHPGLVDMGHARDFPARQAGLTGHLGLSPAGKLGWQMQDLNAAGACGNAAAATAATGAALVDHAARQVVALLEEVQRLPVDWLDTRPDPDAFA